MWYDVISKEAVTKKEKNNNSGFGENVPFVTSDFPNSATLFPLNLEETTVREIDTHQLFS